ncbi:aryl-hydrocarbon-interacting protein-like 1 [Pelecanus crispus]|uniref:aryl-hydrocarbon-interacting protein-like 1 n=1 Tax=Pelecanus crispus TaxID=36300 RepID=UPI003F5D4CE7
MEETYLLNVEGVKKKILHGGQGELPKLQDGSKITFHFQTLKDNFERTVIDDSREAGIPMEIIVGKMFKLEIWETLLSSMRAGEVAEFWCDAIHTGMYALVSRGMRRIAEGRDPLEGQKHRCGMGNMFDYHSTGYDDLDELQRTPQPLIFIMELFRVEEPSAYKRDTWAMSKEEKLAAVPVLHSEGNRLVLRKEFGQAAAKYQEAVICLRNLQAKEKPWEDGWLKLESLVTPLVLNYCQCQLELGEYYEVLEHTTELLQKHNDNAKAYFKRAKAHAAVWNEREAREDFLRVAHLDPSMAAAVKKELKELGERMRKKHVEDRKRYQGLFQPPQGLQASKRQESGGVGNRAMLQEEVCQGEVGVLDTTGQAEQGAGTKEAEQPGADQAEQGTLGAGCEEAAPGEAAQGQSVGVEVESRDGTKQQGQQHHSTWLPER